MPGESGRCSPIRRRQLVDGSCLTIRSLRLCGRRHRVIRVPSCRGWNLLALLYARLQNSYQYLLLFGQCQLQCLDLRLPLLQQNLLRSDH